MDINDKEDILSQLKDKLPQKEYDTLKDYVFETQANLFPENTKLISCQHEIVFSINANVLEENEEGEPVGSKEMCVRTYHIPVPEGLDYQEYLNSFFKFFEDLLLQTLDRSKPKEANNNE
jgi:hypothetical protein